MDSSVSHDRAARRFEVNEQGSLCELDYSLEDGVMRIEHTQVPAAVGGRGIASALVLAAMQAARAEGWKVSPACSYADVWMQRHPDYADLRV
ncbi:MAG: GNAT family N-acetyltransferase [Rhodanobacter sp.]